MKVKKMLASALSALIIISSVSGCNNTPADTQGGEEITSAPAGDMSAPQGITGAIRDFSSIELIEEITVGWNLGNTLDATGGSGLNSETSWGNPKTTKELLDAVKAKGFDLIRIPVTWKGHLDGEDNIDPEWMDRVQEVVNYAIDENTYVIINLHHEDWNYPFYDNQEAATAKIKKLWSQIAERFKDYDEHLIFEGQNEPRKVGTNQEWGGGDDEGWDVVNATNAAFIETVRASGGNNEKRHLMVPGYCATSDAGAPDRIVLPENDDKIIVSVHAYLPYTFALSSTPSSKFSSERPAARQEIEKLAENLKTKYIDNGIAVIIGETGARNKDNLDSRIDWAGFYTSTMRNSGITCVWWDNGAFSGGGENFGLINRKDNTWKFPEVADAFVKGAQR